MSNTHKDYSAQIAQNLKDYDVYKALAPHIAEPAMPTTPVLDKVFFAVSTVVFVATLAMTVLALGGK